MDGKDLTEMYDQIEDFMDDYPHLKSIEKILEDFTDEESYDEPESNTQENTKTQGKFKLITKRIDFPKIYHKKETGLSINSSICSKIKLTPEANVRCGAIIYTHYRGKTYFCVGVDADYGDLTDFAGGVKKTDLDIRGNPSVIAGGLRELKEESLGIFGNLSTEDVKNDLVFWSSNMAIMFIKMSVNPEEITKKFQEEYSKHSDKNSLEVSEIKWMTFEDFRDAILSKGQRMYSRVRKILSRVVEIIEVL